MKNYDDLIGNRNCDLPARCLNQMRHRVLRYAWWTQEIHLVAKKKTQGKRASVQTRVLVRAVPKCIVLLKRVCDENMEECPRLALLATDEYDAPDAVLLR